MRYPLDITNDDYTPWVIFSPFKYEMPEANVQTAIPKNTADGESIQLYLPNNVSEKYGATWENEQLFNSGDIPNEITNLMSNVAKKNLGDKMVASIGASMGKVAGPTDLLVFKSPQQPDLNFTFQFVPSTQAEGNVAVKICQEFKKRVLPKTEKGTIWAPLVYPNVWNLQFLNINCIGSQFGAAYYNMALTNVDVSYSGGANSVLVFWDKNPVEISLQLSFKSIQYAVQV